MWLKLLAYFSGARRRLVRLRRIFLRKVIPPKILIVRNDGMGDFILTLPIISAIKAQLPHARVYVLASRSLHSMASFLPEIDGWILDPGCLLKRHRKNKSKLQLETEYTNLMREISAYRFDLAIFSYAEKASAELIQAAGIPYRLGPLRRSFFLKFNLWYYIPRRKSSQAEFQLNLKILRSLRLVNMFRFPRVELPQLATPLSKGRYIVMHPYKRSGTALVWPLENFQALARHFSAQNLRTVVIGDREDHETLHAYFGTIPSVEIRADLNLVQTAVLIAGAQHFFGNSSGPLHLAALVQTPHTGFYPQNKTASPRRWRTLPFNENVRLSQHLLSTSLPVACVACRLKRCAYYPCTAGITVESAANSVTFWKPKPAPRMAKAAKKPARKKSKKAQRRK
ncbi:glycosyltransferase family 9 protein [Turneriella parva]|uniref:Glycosyl transferase family 9 n=1 Tax=Turneriella parva (strain ATCC BAA-1111 / DSM 21527 / NCTC 11395 / H) TaxID=869212 RepID=I4BBV0_TURPD|nr:glycosyltransferase family 9 protein [Turneriella parva]AFM14757.1 glycosyl transferase family 9 [Turneriella parva DSM 21527]